MKRILFIGLSLLFSSVVSAQAPTNFTAVDCSGNSETLYNILSTGKSVIVAHKGVDCSICVNSAPGWQTWAAANTSKVRVWGAITYTYSPSQFTTANMCTKTNQWVSTHNWTDIFTFPDSNRVWVNGGSPRYYVYSGIDSSLVYQGSNSTTARNTALAQTTVGLRKNLLGSSTIYVANKQLQMRNLPTSVESVMIYNLKGQLLLSERINGENQTINIDHLNTGVYIARFTTNNERFESVKLSLN